MNKKLSEEEKTNIRNSIKSNLEFDFVENYHVWKSSLIDVNDIIRNDIKKHLFITPFMEDLLYTYDELCQESLSIVDSLTFDDDNSVDAISISREITQQVTMRKLLDIVQLQMSSRYII